MTEMLIGLARPNSELSIISQLKRIASGLPPEPFTIDSNDPRADALTALILQCRDPNPAMRPADAEAFVDRLDSLGTRGYVGTIPEPTIMMPVEALAHADETVIFEDNATNSIPLDASDHDTALTGQATITAKTSPEGTAPDRAATPVAGTPEHNPKTSRLRPLVIVALTSLCLMAALWTQYARSPEEPETTTETNSIESEGNTAQESSASVATSNHPSALVAAHPQKAPTAKTRIAPVSETPPIVIQPHANTAAPLAARIDQSQSTYRPQRRRRITTEITPFLRTVTVVTTPRSAVIRRAGKLLGTGTAAITWKSDEPGPKLTLTAPGFRTKTVTLGPDTKDEVTLTLRKSKQRVPVRDFYPLPK